MGRLKDRDHLIGGCAAALPGGSGTDRLAVVVNALDEDAARFWARWEFLASRDNPLVLFRSIPDIAASLARR
jgi:hypothetical protein